MPSFYTHLQLGPQKKHCHSGFSWKLQGLPSTKHEAMMYWLWHQGFVSNPLRLPYKQKNQLFEDIHGVLGPLQIAENQKINGQLEFSTPISGVMGPLSWRPVKPRCG